MPTAHPPLPTATPADLGLCPERTRRMVEVMQTEVNRGYIPGAVVLIARHGHIALHEAVGQLDPGKGAAMTTDAIFRIYSMTKPVVSVALMMLMEQGRCLLSDPVAKYLPEFAHLRVAVETANGIELQPVIKPPTVQDLLRHTAGLTYGFLGTAHVQRQYTQATSFPLARSNAEFSRALAELPLYLQPGTRWAYSHATDVLGRLVEVLSGQSLGIFLDSAILSPLGMRDTAFVVPPEKHHRIAEPFDHDPDGGQRMAMLNPRQAPKFESGGGGLMSTSADYARFLQCMLNRGELDGVRLLGSHTVDHMTADHLGTLPADGDLLPPGHGFGLGFAVRTHAGLSTLPGTVGTYHWSGIGGTAFFVDPAEDFFAMVMTQAPNQRDPIRQLFRNLAYATLAD